jgi:hypothetical protein
MICYESEVLTVCVAIIDIMKLIVTIIVIVSSMSVIDYISNCFLAIKIFIYL